MLSKYLKASPTVSINDSETPNEGANCNVQKRKGDEKQPGHKVKRRCRDVQESAATPD